MQEKISPFSFNALVYCPEPSTVCILETDSKQADDLQIDHIKFGNIIPILSSGKVIPQSKRTLQVFEFYAFSTDKDGEHNLFLNCVKPVNYHKVKDPVNKAIDKMRLRKTGKLENYTFTFSIFKDVIRFYLSIVVTDKKGNKVGDMKGENLSIDESTVQSILDWSFKNDAWTPKWDLRTASYRPVEFTLDFDAIEREADKKILNDYFTDEVCYFCLSSMKIIDPIFKQ